MKKFLILTILAAFFSCSSEDEGTAAAATATSGFTNLPNNLTQPLAKGLTGQGSAAAAAAEALEVAASVSEKSQMYLRIKNNMAMFNNVMDTVTTQFVAYDEILNTLADGECIDDYTITFTDVMCDKILANSSKYNELDEEFKTFVNNLRNTTVSAADMGGSAIKIESIDTAGFTKQVTLSYTIDSNYSSSPDCNGTSKDILRYNNDKTKTQFKSTQVQTGLELSILISNDDANKKTTIGFTGKYDTNNDGNTDYGVNESISLRTCSDSEAANTNGNCNIVSITGDYNIGSDSFKTSGEAKSDDSGGYGILKYHDGSTTKYYKEAWAGNGDTLYVGTSTNGSSYNLLYGDEDNIDADYVQDSYEIESTWTFSSSVTTDGSYLIVISGQDPNSNTDAILGSGFKDSNVAPTLEWEFWGAAAGTYDIWTFNSSDGTMSDQGTDIQIAAK